MNQTKDVPLRSYLISGTTMAPEIEAALRKSQNLGPDREIVMQVFEVHFGDKVRYCCWSGGKLPDNPSSDTMPELTLAGMGALSALVSLPFLPTKKLVLKQMGLGKTPLKQKVLDTFYQTSGSQAPICFFGDLTQELDGHVALTMNFQGMVELEDCVLAKAAPATQATASRRPR